MAFKNQNRKMNTEPLFMEILQSLEQSSDISPSDKLSSLHDAEDEKSFEVLSWILGLIGIRANVVSPEIDVDMSIEHVSKLYDDAEELEASDALNNFSQIAHSLTSGETEQEEEVAETTIPKPYFFNRDFKESPIMDKVRLSLDIDTISSLNQRFGLDQILESYKPTKDEVRIQKSGRARAMRLTEKMNSRVHSLLRRALQALGNPFEVTLFIEDSPFVNASATCEHIIAADCRISITSRAIELLNDDEMLFLLGHEIGHHYYGHFYGMILPDAYGGEHVMPDLLKLKLCDWGHYTEFSADRCGFAATGFNSKATMSAFFKMECGLGPDHIGVDEGTIIDAVDDIKKLNSPDIFCYETHPLSPLRAYAINSLSNALSTSKDIVEAIASVEGEAIGLAQMSDFQDMTEESQHFRNLIAASGLILAKADGDEMVEGGELNKILTLLTEYSSSPEELLTAIGSRDAAVNLVNESGAWLSENVGAERFTVYGSIADIAVVDGECAEDELQFLADLAGLLSIPENWVAKMLEAKLHGELPLNLMTEPPSIALK